MTPDLERLIRLQQLDTTIDEARRETAAHPQRLADAEARLDEATQALDAAKHRLKTSQDTRRDLEKEAAVFQGRLTKFKEQLSAVKTNREYTAMQHEIEAAQRDLGAVEEKVLLEASLKEASEKRAALVAQTDPGMIARFEQVAKARKGIAMSRATYDGLCTACHVRLRPHVFQQIRQNDTIIQCDSCQRIMYYLPPPPPVEQAVTHRS